MKYAYIFALALIGMTALPVNDCLAEPYEASDKKLSLPEDLKTIGDTHGDVAVDSEGNIYVSVGAGNHAGIQIYQKDGSYKGNLKNAPADFHGFIIQKESDGEFLYGSRMKGKSILKMDLSGKVLLTIDAKVIDKKYQGKKGLRLTNVAVGPNGDIYVVDGYGIDYIHRFDKAGKYLSTFGGRKPPYKLANCHKIAIDHRFVPARILCCDRRNNRLLHLDLDGKMIGVYAENLRRPSAVAFYKDEVAVAEIYGRVTVLDKEGKTLQTVSDNPAIKGGNNWPADGWKPGLVITPHGICVDKNGNLLVSEYNKFGRVLFYDRK